jgi:hypothetical protein
MLDIALFHLTSPTLKTNEGWAPSVSHRVVPIRNCEKSVRVIVNEE